MKPQGQTAVSRYLVWVFLQGAVFLSAVAGQNFWEDLDGYGWFTPVAVLLLCWVGFVLARNLIRLWRAPANEARRSHLLPLFLTGALFVLFSSGPLLESDRWSTKPVGAAWLAVGANLLALGGREILRLRAQRRISTTV